MPPFLASLFMFLALVALIVVLGWLAYQFFLGDWSENRIEDREIFGVFSSGVMMTESDVWNAIRATRKFSRAFEVIMGWQELYPRLRTFEKRGLLGPATVCHSSIEQARHGWILTDAGEKHKLAICGSN